MKTDGVNRTLLTLGGLLFLGSGGGILAAGLGAFGPGVKGRPVITADSLRMLTSNDTRAWAVIIAVGVVSVLLGLAWLLLQPRVERLTRLDLEADHGRGRVRLSARALTDAVATEVEQVHGVERAAARLIRRHGIPELRMAIRLTQRADLGEARRHVEDVALPHAREVIAPDPLPSRVRLDLARAGPGDRVR